jgi:predicted transcriptional regulator
MTNDQRLVFEILERDEWITLDEIALQLHVGSERVAVALAYLISQQAVVRDSSTIPTKYRRW